MKNAERTTTALKIMQQTRIKGGMSYSLKCEGVLLTLTISPRTSEEDRDAWHVAARAKRPERDDVAMDEWGPTRIDALRALGRTWVSNQFDHGLGMFDWEAVAKVLAEVRAV
jgi:hypothetical protein